MDIHPRIASWADLKQGWDSYGGDPPTPEAIDLASKLLRLFEKAPHPCPSNDGGFQLEWNNKELDLEIEFTPKANGKWEGVFFLIEQEKFNEENRWPVLLSYGSGDEESE